MSTLSTCMEEKMSKIEEAVETVIKKENLDKNQDVELVDVEYVKERNWYLRVFIDKAGGIGLDDCQKFSEALGKILDSHDEIITGSYILEVSSPGLDRPLKKERDFVRERGKEVDVNFYAPINGQKSLTGVLAGYDGESLILEGFEPISMAKVSSVRLHIDF